MSTSGEQRPAPSPITSAKASDPASAALAAMRARTPARLIVGRAGTSYRTATQLGLRTDHAAAVDAVQTELELKRDFDPTLVARYDLFDVSTQARDKAEFLRRPELGRKLNNAARSLVAERCPRGVDLQVAIGDGLSAAAAITQAPALAPLLAAGAAARRWSFGRVVVIHHCRVGVLNDLGELLDPAVVVLLIGERPGLATAESLSAYLAYRPRSGHTDAQRNLISNIHARGVDPAIAAERILALVDQMRAAQTSGVAIKEQLPGAAIGATDAKVIG